MVGVQWVNVSVTDGHGGVDWQNFTITVTNVNDAPLITTMPLTIAIEDVGYCVEYDAIDIDPTNDTITWAIVTNASWLTINETSGLLSGMPTNASKRT